MFSAVVCSHLAIAQDYKQTGCAILHNFWLLYERGIKTSDDDSDNEDQDYWRSEVEGFVNPNGQQARVVFRKGVSLLQSFM